MTELTRIVVPLTQWVKDFAEGRDTGVPVPCGECHICCTRPIKPQLYPNETKMFYKKKFNKSVGKFNLKAKANGECVYLTTNGCSIHTMVPKVCKVFDCRFMGYFKIVSPTHMGLNEAIKRWIFLIDNQELHQWLREKFQLGVRLLPEPKGDPVDRLGVTTIYAGYEEFFVKRNQNG